MAVKYKHCAASSDISKVPLSFIVQLGVLD